MNLSPPDLTAVLAAGQLHGEAVEHSERTLGDLGGVFADEAARLAMDPTVVAYRVQRHLSVADGTPGGLYFGTSFVEPGRVGDEYFMTKGHFHVKRECGEYYWCLEGGGVLVLMDEDRKTWGVAMEPGVVHYIPGHTAHRLVNTGDRTLVVGACWPSDAGHDYASIAARGFGARVLDRDGEPTLVTEGRG
ncbi:MAG: glucose-6-phosphate isomerase family protein [Planctomycetota bacterium]